MTPKQKEELQKEFAAFLQKSISQPTTEIPKEFYNTSVTLTVATIRNYCSRILTENQDVEKINRIKQFYNLKGVVSVGKDKIVEMTEIDKLLLELETNKENARSVVQLFKSKTVSPNEETLSFAAFLINLPITSLEEFKKWKEANPYQSTTEIETPNTLDEINHKTEIIEPQTLDTQIIEDTPKTIDEVTPPIIPLPPTFWQKNKSKLFIAASLVILLVISAYAYNLNSYITERKDKLDYIDKIEFTPIVADSGLVEASLPAQNLETLPTTTTDNADNPLVFYTNNIYNGKFLYTTDKWEFATDKNGEDMNSVYGEPYKDQIKGLFKAPNNLPTIANKSIWLRFNVLNKSSQKLYIDNIKLEKVGTYKIDTKKVKWNSWITPKDGEKRFELLLTHEPQISAIVAFAEIAPQNPQHFSLIINTDNSCENYIYKFKLVISANDAQGKRYTITSDKMYSLGRISEL